ncbi:phospholipase D family protein [Paraclostridium sordellii]|uniref:phospholipase D family protein n=1 Tax=Paraclostridium sordellii TaxID=1505 RepID=UPI000C769CFA|nr:phospholipase D family protein [Paeniclostridium sordellii]AUN14317.1 hypothetical protein RSJ16_08820 [Paeniclostridium sordellii]MDU5021245.1 phospholipase D family protein [Clostridiales bacterium]
MNLCIQDPKYPESYSLHEALLGASEGAINGGAVYAFVSAGGVKLLLANEKFKNILKNGSFELIVGIDEITNTKTLEKLGEIQEKYNGNLKVRAFLNNTKSSLFHPKFCWFEKESGGVLVTGSGNLTEKGLRKNREIFNVIEVDSENLKEIQEQWENWLNYNSELLKPIDDEYVKAKAEYNKIRFVNDRIKESIKNKKISEELYIDENKIEIDDIDLSIDIENIFEEDIEAWDCEDDDVVLICEIPKNGDRLKQANFDKDSFLNFFGVGQAGIYGKIVIFRNILENGTICETEERPAVAVLSQNYRFELDALSGLTYPNDGNKPIGIFIRISTRMFIYMITMPTNSYYNEVKEFLYKNTSISRSDRMKRYNTNVKTLKVNCENIPIWKNFLISKV